MVLSDVGLACDAPDGCLFGLHFTLYSIPLVRTFSINTTTDISINLPWGLWLCTRGQTGL